VNIILNDQSYYRRGKFTFLMFTYQTLKPYNDDDDDINYNKNNDNNSSNSNICQIA